uniref:C6 domain-containing protein n=1 Tax=Rhabditophanes sp. KR3021 TaxID=114890 RepID=A0AC35U1I2_9BILA
MSRILCLQVLINLFILLDGCASNGGNDPTATTVAFTTASTACSTCTSDQITFTPAAGPGTEDATFEGYQLNAAGCYEITAICDASDDPTDLSFMQFNQGQGGPTESNNLNVVKAVLNCENGQWVYNPAGQVSRVVTEVNCLRA